MSDLDRTPEISVVVPVYRGEPYVAELCSRVGASIRDLGVTYEIILVEDRSPDASWDAVRAAAEADKHVKGVRLSRNHGQHAAITAGIDRAAGRWIVVMDCDLQDLPEDIGHLYKTATKNSHDVVVARRHTEDVGLLKGLSSRWFVKIFRAASGIDFSSGNFRIFSRRVAIALGAHREQLRTLPALMAVMGFRESYVDVHRPERPGGGSSYSFRKLLSLALDTLIGHSEKPLWAALYIGSATSCLAILGAIVTTLRVLLYGSAVEGWASLFITMVFLFGIQFGLMGVVGIYVGRVFREVKGRPLYIVSDETS